MQSSLPKTMKPVANINRVLTAMCGLCLLMLASFTNHTANAPEAWFSDTFKWAVLKNSSLSIKGSSNVNTFGCSSSGSFSSETIHGRVLENQSVELKGAITISVNSFDCNNRMLTNDLRKTLKSSEFPNMRIHFINLERVPLTHDDYDYVGGDVYIELAGEKKRFYLRYALTRTADGLTLSGSRAFSFSDFNLSPPQKVGGMIKVNDDFDVSFKLVIRSES